MTKCLARTSIFVILLSVLQGCGVIIYGTPWSRTNYVGPMLFESKRADVVTRCAAIPGFMSRGPCEIAFVDHLGEKVLWLDVQNAIDEYLPKVATLVSSAGSRPGAPTLSQYEFHILTISPVVVLALPRRNTSPFEDSYCGGQIYENGCIPSKKIQLGSYWYRREMMMGAGSFWFSPTLSSGVTFLPDDALTYTIKLPDSRIDLIARPNIESYRIELIPQPHMKIVPKGNEWSIRRYAVTK